MTRETIELLAWLTFFIALFAGLIFYSKWRLKKHPELYPKHNHPMRWVWLEWLKTDWQCPACAQRAKAGNVILLFYLIVFIIWLFMRNFA